VNNACLRLKIGTGFAIFIAESVLRSSDSPLFRARCERKLTPPDGVVRSSEYPQCELAPSVSMNSGPNKDTTLTQMRSYCTMSEVSRY
jgi:hypothetical protein